LLPHYNGWREEDSSEDDLEVIAEARVEDSPPKVEIEKLGAMTQRNFASTGNLLAHAPN